MSPLEQRIAIAQACGWEMIPGEKPAHYGTFLGLLNGKTGFIPDYLNDLNAMHDAEGILATEEERNHYINEIFEIVERDHDDEGGENTLSTVDHEFGWGRATASQRAEAFVKTLGLWKEDDA